MRSALCKDISGDAFLVARNASRRSSGSIRAESAVEPTRSENITVTWRRSAVLELRFFVLGLRWCYGRSEMLRNGRQHLSSSLEASLAGFLHLRWFDKLAGPASHTHRTFFPIPVPICCHGVRSSTVGYRAGGSRGNAVCSSLHTHGRV